MTKKIFALAGAGALLLSMVGPALALNFAAVDNSANASAFTGGNSQNNTAKATLTMSSGATVGSNGNRTINTGEADAYAGALVVANTDVSCGCGIGCGCPEDDMALVGNRSTAYADTGVNAQDDYARVLLGANSGASAGDNGNRTITTKSANSTARAWTVVNTHWGN